MRVVSKYLEFNYTSLKNKGFTCIEIKFLNQCLISNQCLDYFSKDISTRIFIVTQVCFGWKTLEV